MSWLESLPLVGGLLGAVGSSGSTTQSANRDPWGPSQPYLLDNLKMLQALQKQYMAQPFNPMQQSYLGQINSDIQGFRGNMPALLKGYQRGGSTTIPLTFGNAGMGQQASPFPMTGVPTIPNVPEAPKAVAPAPMPVTSQQWPGRQTGIGGNELADHDASSYYAMSPQERAMFMAERPTLNMIDRIINSGIDSSPVMSGLLRLAGDDGTRSWVRAAADSVGPSNDGDNNSARAAGYNSAKDSNTSYGGGGDGGDGGGAATGGRDGDASGGGDRGTRGGFAKGGMVKKKDLKGPDPKGPDEGKANLQSGEYVIRKAAVKKVGKGLLDVINKA